MRLSRRQFVQGTLGVLGGASLFGYLRSPKAPPIPGQIRGANFQLGHRLRGGKFPPVTQTSDAGVVIVGGGIAGLSAGWRLQKKGFSDFTVLELENQAGGNSQSGENPISAYPWGAHYVPLPGPSLTWVRELFEELGVIEGYDLAGRPRYRETYLCAAPQERLFIYGRWQEGLLPQHGVSERDRLQYRRFFEQVEKFRVARGRDGKRLFELPVEESSQDPEILELDRLSFSAYLGTQGWDSRPLRWYLDYCCRDDYGTPLEQVSAWAGLHYFAARNGTGADLGSSEGTLLTWPEGNGWIVKQLTRKLEPHLRRSALTYRITSRKNRVQVEYYDAAADTCRRIHCHGVILAAPRFIAAHLLEDFRSSPPSYLRSFSYAPWMVANLSVRGLPAGNGFPLCWDNVLFDSPGLGYVVATHQSLKTRELGTVLTYYRPLTEAPPDIARRTALGRSFESWTELILNDLRRAHPNLRQSLTGIDVWLWGHGMIRPTPGFLWGDDRRRASEAHGRVVFAHSDMSGLSLFEEAQYRGIRAADHLLSQLKNGVTVS